MQAVLATEPRTAQRSAKPVRAVFYSCYPGFAGSQRMALQIAEAFRARGHHPVAAAPADMEFLDRARSAGLETRVIAAPAQLLRFGGSLLDESAPGTLRTVVGLGAYTVQAALTLNAIGPDVVYAAQERAVLQIGAAARLCRKPIIWHAQGGLKHGSRRMHLSAALLAHRIVGVSEAVVRDIEDTLGPRVAPKLSVIYNGIPDLRPPRRTAATDGRSVVLFAGNVTPEKGVHHLLTAFLALPPVLAAQTELWIAGRTRPDFEALLRTRAERANASNVRFLGFRDDIPELMERASIVACPSVEQETLEIDGIPRQIAWKEGFCLSALEAMRAGVPVLASRSYGLVEVVSDGTTGLLVPPSDATALGSALERMLRDQDLRARLGDAGRHRFETAFSSVSMEERFANLLLSLSPRAAA